MKREINMRHIPNKEAPKNKPAEMKEEGSIITDPNGSYTGVPSSGDGLERPIQDVDDL